MMRTLTVPALAAFILFATCCEQVARAGDTVFYRQTPADVIDLSNIYGADDGRVALVLTPVPARAPPAVPIAGPRLRTGPVLPTTETADAAEIDAGANRQEDAVAANAAAPAELPPEAAVAHSRRGKKVDKSAFTTDPGG